MPRAIPGRPSEAAPRAAPLIALRPDGTSWLGACGKNPACVKPDGHRGACKCNVSMKEVEYEVEAVLAERAVAGGCTRTAGCPKPDRHRGRCPRHRELASREYLVKWKDWPDEDATWETEDALDGAPEVLAAWRAAVLARTVEAGEATLRVEAERRPRPPLADPELRFAWPVLLAPAAVLSGARAAALARRWPTPAELEARRARHLRGATRGRRATPPAPEKAPPMPAAPPTRERPAAAAAPRTRTRAAKAPPSPPRAKRKRASAGG